MRCLVLFYDEWKDFRRAELNSLLEIHGLPRLSEEEQLNQCFLIMDIPNFELAKCICARSVLINHIFELWSHSNDFNVLVDDLRNTHTVFLPLESRTVEKSWSITIHTYCKTYSEPQKEDCRLNFKFISFGGRVKSQNADLDIWAILNYSSNRAAEIVSIPTVPAYFGRRIASGGMRAELRKYDLKKRLYLGPTSLDHALALIMANLAQIKLDCIALDPFVGTGSILIGLAHFGSQCFGTEIDMRVLKGEMYAGSGDRSIKRNIYENFKMYGLQQPELIRMDNHCFDRHCDLSAAACSVADGLYDAIVTDPPYGIRAGAKKSGKRNGVKYSIPDERRVDHMPATQAYPVEEVMLDLLHMAARSLVLGGRLVYVIPTVYNFSALDLPQHPCLKLEALCEQPLSTTHGRHVVVLVKIARYSPDMQLRYQQYKHSVLAGEDLFFGQLMHKLEMALSSNSFENEAVVKQISKATMRRKESKMERKRKAMINKDLAEGVDRVCPDVKEAHCEDADENVDEDN